MTPYTQHYLLGQQFRDPRLQATFEAETHFLLKQLRRTRLRNPTVLNIGCGNGRSLFNLVDALSQNPGKIKTGRFDGVDIDKGCIEGAEENILDHWSPNFRYGFMVADARRLNLVTSQDLVKPYALTFSSYKTLGGLNQEDRNKIIDEMVRVTRPRGVITNLTWKRDEITDDFLEEYYPAIGFDIVHASTIGTSVRSRHSGQEFYFQRIHPTELIIIFNHHGFSLDQISVEEVGPLWVAVTGVKQGGRI
jgi:ubiquinone/menaquinone biosynthesis C-methylase UbiE